MNTTIYSSTLYRQHVTAVTKNCVAQFVALLDFFVLCDVKMDDYKKRIIEFVRACGSVASCIDAVCRAYPMEGAVKACGTLCADVLCAACRVPSLSYGGRRQSMWHVACLRAVCGMPCAEPILWRAQSKRVARCVPTCCVLHAVCFLWRVSLKAALSACQAMTVQECTLVKVVVNKRENIE